MKVQFFETRDAFRRWLKKNHAKVDELYVGFYKKASGRKTVEYHEAVEEALCFGWIDGVRKSIDDISYTNRFSPRKPRSKWSRINIARVERLIKEGRMDTSGLDVYQARDTRREAGYSFEQRDAPEFTPAQTKRFRGNRAAWKFWEAQPPGYRRLATFYVISAKREETRLRRLEQLIADSEAGRRLGILAPRKQRA